MKEKGPIALKTSEKSTITISFDEETAKIFRDLKKCQRLSQSELMRTALKFYDKHKTLFNSFDNEKIYTYKDMLSSGEHVILDMDHWMLFLNFIESHPKKDNFWKIHRKVSKAHAEEFIHKNYDTEMVLRRLEACNLFKLSKTSNTEFTLILGYNAPKKIVKMELEYIFTKMDMPIDISEDLSKLRIKILP